MSKPVASVVMGSDSDLRVMKEATEFLEEMGVSVEVTIVSAHRTPDRLFDFAKKAHERGIEVVIAGAGGAAHLPGMIASISPLPVIGVPINSSNSIDGVDSVLSILQMPAGVPVATVAVDGGKNAGILAAEILSVKDGKLRKKLIEFKKGLAEGVKKKFEKLEKEGYVEYLKGK